MTWSDGTTKVTCELCGHHIDPSESAWWQGEVIVCKDEVRCQKRQAVNNWVEDREKEEGHMSVTAEFPIIDLKEKNPNKYQDRARQIVVDYYNQQLLEIGEELHISQVYVVWFTKVLQNWKAMVATDVEGDGMYFELTHNGDKQETYLDVYKKISNEAVPDV
ncbi:hypothetical protein PP914_gp091 [Arthrobacter phage Qui]|uniref:Phage protein n=1 Tax=Arthrobacter phage Qui TaxID=2603260 RepID=A0A5B8WH08_9CAUD|nr:hypothetical protein PP914_gp091 [Arthrobacter phage Qui]QED11581.1 hypothetical protein SEA_QUI_91 [Arthrobacter phage Qui]QOC56413.1 hypothetical protein SEA_PAELLA_91 [Arthrobacter phage Paella]